MPTEVNEPVHSVFIQWIVLETACPGNIRISRKQV